MNEWLMAPMGMLGILVCPALVLAGVASRWEPWRRLGRMVRHGDDEARP